MATILATHGPIHRNSTWKSVLPTLFIFSCVLSTNQSAIAADEYFFTDCSWINFDQTAVAIAVPACATEYNQMALCKAQVKCLEVYVRQNGSNDPKDFKLIKGQTIFADTVCSGKIVQGKPTCETSDGSATQCANDHTTEEQDANQLTWSSGNNDSRSTIPGQKGL